MTASIFQTEDNAGEYPAELAPSELLDTDLRDLIAVPRNIPRSARENISKLIVTEILSEKSYEIKDEEKFIEEFGAFYPIFITLRNSKVWDEFKKLAKSSRMAAVLGLQKLLSLIFDLMDSCQDPETCLEKPMDGNFEKSLSELKDILLKTMELWDRRVSGIAPKGSEKLDSSELGSDKLVSGIKHLMESEASMQLIDSLVKSRILSEMESCISELDGHLESLELLTMLFPGRMWDYSLRQLHREYFGNLEKYAGIIAKNIQVQKILEYIGRIELEYGTKKLSVSPFAKSETHSVTFSGDFQHILPMEIVKLKNPLLKRKFYADMLEGKLLTYQLRGKSWVGGPPTRKRKGPLVALVDTSGSMHGDPEILAKALILAITKRMLKEQRDVKVVLFSSVGQSTDIELTNKRKMGKEFLDFIQYSFGGGTDFDTALLSGLKALKNEQFRGADLLFITDGLSSILDERAIQEWNSIKKEEEARIFTMIVGNNNQGGLQKISDYSYIIQSADKWNIMESPANVVKLIAAPEMS